MQFKSKHKLDFEIAPWITDEFIRFKVGTCKGLWQSFDSYYAILAITNDKPGNGHFEDVLQWFYNSCIRDKKDLVIMQVMNKKFKKHLIEKRGFKEWKGPEENSVIKKLKDIKKQK